MNGDIATIRAPCASWLGPSQRDRLGTVQGSRPPRFSAGSSRTGAKWRRFAASARQALGALG